MGKNKIIGPTSFTFTRADYMTYVYMPSAKSRMVFSYTPTTDINTQYDLSILVAHTEATTPSCQLERVESAARTFATPGFTCTFAANVITLKATDLKSKATPVSIWTANEKYTFIITFNKEYNSDN